MKNESGLSYTGEPAFVYTAPIGDIRSGELGRVSFHIWGGFCWFCRERDRSLPTFHPFARVLSETTCFRCKHAIRRRITVAALIEAKFRPYTHGHAVGEIPLVRKRIVETVISKLHFPMTPILLSIEVFKELTHVAQHIRIG